MTDLTASRYATAAGQCGQCGHARGTEDSCLSCHIYREGEGDE